MSKKVLLATHNKGKVQEFQTALKAYDFHVIGLNDLGIDDEVKETGHTFEENALLKAQYYGKKTGLTALADDSGLEVDILGFAPGIYSARYAEIQGNPFILNLALSKDDKNILQLLKDLNGKTQRQARFSCCLALVFPVEEKQLTVHGYWEGSIGLAPKGQNGFGYDPIFVDNLTDKTAAELSFEEKLSCSHRGKAIRLLVEKLHSEKFI